MNHHTGDYLKIPPIIVRTYRGWPTHLHKARSQRRQRARFGRQEIPRD